MASCFDVKKEPMQWSKCCLCQMKKNDKLQTPKADGYVSLQSHLQDLHKLNALPSLIYDYKLLDEGPGIVVTLHSHAAVYHKNCRSACNEQKVQRAQEAQDKVTVGVDDDVFMSLSPKKLRSSGPSETDTKKDICIICLHSDGELQRDPPHKVRSMDADTHMKEWSKATNNFLLHARLVTKAADSHAADLIYHLNCYTKLRYDATLANKPASETMPNLPVYDPLVTAQLVVYMIESKGEVFNLATLKKLYLQRLYEMGRLCDKEINSTRFKEHVLKHLPDGWTAVTKGTNTVYFSHNDTMGKIMTEATNQQNIDQDEAILVMKAMSILRKNSMFPQKPFNGSFDANCLSNSVPELLFTSMNMLLQGSKDGLEGLGDDVDMSQRTKAALTLCQLIIFNMVKHTPSENTKYMRHPKEYETPVPLYWGIRMHSEQRVKATLDDGSDMGLFVNSQRVREVKVQVARAVSKRIKEEGVVVPTNMRKDVFTTCDCDNLDHLKRCNLSNAMFNGSLLTFTNHL